MLETFSNSNRLFDPRCHQNVKFGRLKKKYKFTWRYSFFEDCEQIHGFSSISSIEYTFI